MPELGKITLIKIRRVVHFLYIILKAGTKFKILKIFKEAIHLLLMLNGLRDIGEHHNLNNN
jgi:hypothetical protein